MQSDRNIERDLLQFASTFSGRLPPEDIANAAELIVKREWGVGLEILCAQLAEYDIKLSENEAERLRRIATTVGVDIGGFGILN